MNPIGKEGSHVIAPERGATSKLAILPTEIVRQTTNLVTRIGAGHDLTDRETRMIKIQDNEYSVPAYITFKYSSRCRACGSHIPAGEKGFYMREGNQCWHFQCGNPNWKLEGTPYANRKAKAIEYAKQAAETKDTSAKAPDSISTIVRPPAAAPTLHQRAYELLQAIRDDGGEMLGRDLPVPHDSRVVRYLRENNLVTGEYHLRLTEKGRTWEP
jgi:hypothetical protein